MKKTPFNIVVLSAVITCMVVFSVLAVSFSTIFYILISGSVGLILYLVGLLRKRKEAGQ
jgi:chromate transporter